MSQVTDDGDIWGDTSSSFEDQLYCNAILAEEHAEFSQQSQTTFVGQFQAKASVSMPSTRRQNENAFPVYHDLQPGSNTLRNQQLRSAPLGDMSNSNRVFNSTAHFNRHDPKKQQTPRQGHTVLSQAPVNDRTNPPKHMKPSTDTIPTTESKTESHPSLAGTIATLSPPTATNTTTTDGHQSTDDEDNYMWMEFDVDLNALLESVEAKSAQSSTQLSGNGDLFQKQNNETQGTLDQHPTPEDNNNAPEMDQEHIELTLTKFGGFMTAGSKKSLDANPEARKKALALFTDSPNQQCDNIPVKNEIHADTLLLPPPPLPPKELSGFTTASGKNMAAPTKEALSKAERLLSATNDTPTLLPQPIKSFADILVVKSNITDVNPSPTESSQSFTESLQRGIKRTANDNEEDHVEFNYENMLSRYGGFKTGNSRGEFTVSAEAKRQAVALFNASEPVRDHTQSVQSQHIPCSPPHSESTVRSQHQQQPPPLSPLPLDKSDTDIRHTEWTKSPEMMSESTQVKEKLKLSQAPVSNNINVQRLTKRSTMASFKLRAFKSPIIDKNIELTKAAVYRHTPSAIRGTGPCVFRMKANGPRISLRDLGEPGVYTRSQLLAMNISPAVLDMTASLAKDHRFYGWGPQEARSAMLRAGALEKFLPIAWVENHYGSIVWKIAGMMRSFPRQLKDWWSPRKILEQLLYRYEREVNLGQKSTLKRIIEQDDVPGKLMILVIVDIAKRTTGSPDQAADVKRYELLLSDGWYQVSAVADPRLERAISKGRLAIGHKLAICGAQTNIGPQPRSSAAGPNNIVLSIATNGCHIAPWDAKLGYQRQRLVFRSLSTLHDDGGVVTAIDVIVCRKYPIMYSETLSDGSVIVRNAREEEKARQESMSRLYGGVGGNGGSSNEWALPFSEYPQSVMSQQYSKLLQDTNGPIPMTNEDRKVSGYFRVSVCDIPAGNKRPMMTAMLLQLDANEVLHMDICEGKQYRVFFLMPYSPRNRRYPGLNLKTMRKTRWEPVTRQREPDPLAAPSLYVPRHITPCDKIQQDISEEMDIAVVVLCVNSTEKRRQPSGRMIWYQKLLVTDQSKALVQVSIRMPGRPLTHPEGQVIGFTNAQYDMHDAKYEVTHIRITEESEIVTKPLSSAGYLQKAISSLREWVQQHPEDVESLKKYINEKLLHH